MMLSWHGSPRSSVPGSICGCRRTISRRASFGSKDMPDQALHVVAHNIEEADRVGQLLSFCSVLGQAACPIAFWAGDLEAAARYGAMLLDHTERHPVRLWNIWARCFIGLGDSRTRRCRRRAPGVARGLEQAGEARFLPRFLFLQGEQAATSWRRLERLSCRCKGWNRCWRAAKLAMNAGTWQSFSA